MSDKNLCLPEIKLLADLEAVGTDFSKADKYKVGSILGCYLKAALTESFASLIGGKTALMAMKIPKNCLECPMCGEESCRCRALEGEPSSVCDGRRADCPIVGIAPNRRNGIGISDADIPMVCSKLLSAGRMENIKDAAHNENDVR